MSHFEFSVVIDRPMEEVFALVDRPEDYPKWQAGVLEGGDDSEGATGVGSRGWQVRQVFGRPVKMAFEITAYERNKIKGYRSTSGPSQSEGAYLFEEIDGGTKVTVQFDSEMQGLLKLATPIVNQSLQRQWEASLANLKELLENG